MRLIDADALIEELYMDNGMIDRAGLYHSFSYKLSLGEIIDIINRQDTIDIRELKNARDKSKRNNTRI